MSYVQTRMTIKLIENTLAWKLKCIYKAKIWLSHSQTSTKVQLSNSQDTALQWDKIVQVRWVSSTLGYSHASLRKVLRAHGTCKTATRVTLRLHKKVKWWMIIRTLSDLWRQWSLTIHPAASAGPRARLQTKANSSSSFPKILTQGAVIRNSKWLSKYKIQIRNWTVPIRNIKVTLSTYSTRPSIHLYRWIIPQLDPKRSLKQWVRVHSMPSL